MKWKAGTIFSISLFAKRGYWVITEDIDEKRCNVKYLKGDDPRIFGGKTWPGFLKSYYVYGGRVEKGFWLRLINLIK